MLSRRGSNIGCSCSKPPPFLCVCPLNQPMKHQQQSNGIHQRLFDGCSSGVRVKPTRPNVLVGSKSSVYSIAHPPVGQIWKCWVGKLKPRAASPSEVCVWVRMAPISENRRVKEEKGTAGIDKNTSCHDINILPAGCDRNRTINIVSTPDFSSQAWRELKSRMWSINLHWSGAEKLFNLHLKTARNVFKKKLHFLQL